MGSWQHRIKKECNVETKTEKITSQGELDAARENLQGGLATFRDNMFDRSGGSVLATLGQVGISGLCDSTGPKGSPCKYGAEVQVEPAKHAKKKHFMADSVRVVLQE